MFFNQKKLYAPANGILIAITDVEDQVFATKMMGNGFGIDQHDGNVYAPCDGTITDIFPTKHAVTIENKRHQKILVHMGLDTVELKGKPFTIVPIKGASVQQGELIAKMDVRQVEDAGKKSTIVVVIPEYKEGTLLHAPGQVTQADAVFKL